MVPDFAWLTFVVFLLGLVCSWLVLAAQRAEAKDRKPTDLDFRKANDQSSDLRASDITSTRFGVTRIFERYTRIVRYDFSRWISLLTLAAAVAMFAGAAMGILMLFAHTPWGVATLGSCVSQWLVSTGT